MKCRYVLFLLLFPYLVYADICHSFLSEKVSLIKRSSYPVDDITCANGIYRWFISNKRYIYPQREPDLAELIKQSPYNVEKVTITKEGHYRWHITNNLNAKKNHDRSIASPFEAKEQKKIPAKKIKKQAFSLSLNSSVASIANTDTVSGVTEKTVSDIAYGASLYWSHLWSQHLSFFAVGSLKKYQFKVGSSRTLTNNSVSQSYIGIGVNVKLSDRFSIAPGIGLGESFILTSDGSSALTIDKISIPAISLSSTTKLITFKSGFSLNLDARVGALMPTDQKGYSTELGHYYHLGLGSSYDLDGRRLFIKGSYTARELSIGSGDQTSKDLGISMGLGWSF